MIKRLLDIFLAGSGLLLLSPLLLVLVWRIRSEMGAPILFSQNRPGKDGRIFRMIKLRSMRDDIDLRGNLLADEERITPFGLWLRNSSLDELPELWNVLKGDMSIVGPRPLLPEYLSLYSPHQHRRHEVRPGITGWAQINGRNSISWEEKFELDLWYVDNKSTWVDIKIIIKTIRKVVVKEGISASGEATMPKFTGQE